MQCLDKMIGEAAEPGIVPGVAVMVADADQTVFEFAAGVRDGAGNPMMVDTVVWMASMTKAITSVAMLQLVEQGRIALDDEVGRFLPYVDSVQVLDGFDEAGRPMLRAPARPVTLRHLLTHTSGFSYRSWNSDMDRYCGVMDVPSLSEGKLAGIMTPLVCDPGERWEYGVSTDWVGRLVERLADQPFDQYLGEHILTPLGMLDSGFVLHPAVRARFGELFIREADGRFVAVPFEEPPASEFYAGGGDLYSTAPDYMRFLRMLLRGGELDGARILRAKTVRDLARNHIGHLRFRPLKTVKPSISLDFELFPKTPKAWGLAGLINTEVAPTGRGAGSLGWAGIFNTYFWVDFEQGVAGVFMAQTLPFGDRGILDLLGRFERGVYSARG
jgi:methyl acetate hydrolase